MSDKGAPSTRARTKVSTKGKGTAQATAAEKGKGIAKASAKAKAKPTAAAKGKGKSAEEEVERENVPTPGQTRPSEQQYFDKFCQMKSEQGKFVDTETMERMGISDEVWALFENMGLRKFKSMKYEATKALTGKFLATLRAKFYDTEHGNSGFGVLKFGLEGTTYVVNFHELCEIFGFREEGTYGGQYFDYPANELQNLWATIASGEFRAGDSKSASIRHPAIRYAHKALVHNFYHKVEIDTVTTEEMELLGLGLKPILPVLANENAFEGPERLLCLATLLVRHLFHYREWAWKTKSKKAAICLGWVITPILMAKGIKIALGQYDWKSLDMAYLSKVKFFKGYIEGKMGYNLQLTGTSLAQVPLPNPAITNFHDPRNVMFIPPQEYLYNSTVDPPMQAFRKKTQRRTAVEEPIDIDEGEADESSPETVYGSERYHFDPYDGAITSQATRHAHHQTRLLQRMCKWQDKNMKKMVKMIKSLKKMVKAMGRTINELKDGGCGASSSRAGEGGDVVTDANIAPRGEDWELGISSNRPTARQERATKRRAMRSPSPVSSNPSYSMGSTSPSPSF